MPLISHGGAAGLAPANTIESVKAADKFNPVYIEVDINVTKDDEIVMHHGSVTRFMRGKKTTETLVELKEKHKDLVTFRDFLKHTPKSPYMLDIKCVDPDALSEIVKLLKESQHKNFGFTSPHEAALIAVQKNFPSALILQSQPYHHGPIAALELARKNNFGGVMINKWWLSPLFYNLCRIHRKKVGIYTIDSAIALWLSQRFFPSAYITTNRPDRYRDIFPTKSK